MELESLSHTGIPHTFLTQSWVNLWRSNVEYLPSEDHTKPGRELTNLYSVPKGTGLKTHSPLGWAASLEILKMPPPSDDDYYRSRSSKYGVEMVSQTSFAHDTIKISKQIDVNSLLNFPQCTAERDPRNMPAGPVKHRDDLWRECAVCENDDEGDDPQCERSQKRELGCPAHLKAGIWLFLRKTRVSISV